MEFELIILKGIKKQFDYLPIVLYDAVVIIKEHSFVWNCRNYSMILLLIFMK